MLIPVNSEYPYTPGEYFWIEVNTLQDNTGKYIKYQGLETNTGIYGQTHRLGVNTGE
jgi:hypothetical protein